MLVGCCISVAWASARGTFRSAPIVFEVSLRDLSGQRLFQCTNVCPARRWRIRVFPIPFHLVSLLCPPFAVTSSPAMSVQLNKALFNSRTKLINSAWTVCHYQFQFLTNDAHLFAFSYLDCKRKRRLCVNSGRRSTVYLSW